MNESPIERQQRAFYENSKKTRPAKTAGSEYIGVIGIVGVIPLIVVFFLAMA